MRQRHAVVLSFLGNASAAAVYVVSLQLHVDIILTSKEPVCPRVELILKIIIILLKIFLGFSKNKPC